MQYKKAMSFIFIIFFSSLSQANAGGSTTMPGGGDEIEIEVWSLAHKANAVLADSCQDIHEFDGVNQKPCGADVYQQLTQALTGQINIQLQVVTEPLESDGELKTALNDPDLKLIKINRARWQAITSDSGKISILSHEFLGVIGSKIDLSYRISSQIANFMIDRAWKCSAHCGYVVSLPTQVYERYQVVSTFGSVEGEAFEKLVNYVCDPVDRMPTLYASVEWDGTDYKKIPPTQEGACYKVGY